MCCICSVVGFKLRQRALHVYSEKERVPLFKQVCDSSASAAEKTEQLAQLMNDSQDSCRCRTLLPANGRCTCMVGGHDLPGLKLPCGS